ncbi:MAG: hypothetical protein H6989_06365 [Pseudomonadales bacterium]|nr:hypothetical protein [Pseudomonadales bacterium]
MNAKVDQFLFDAILLADSWQVPPPQLEEVIALEARRLAEHDHEPSADIPVIDPYAILQF